MTKKPTAVRLGIIDPATLKITDEPYKGRRITTEGKYVPVFRALQQKQRLVCPPGYAGKLAQQLRNWLRDQGHGEPLVRSQEDYGDGMGGVWWLGAKEPKTTKAPNAPWPTVAAVGGKRKAA